VDSRSRPCFGCYVPALAALGLAAAVGEVLGSVEPATLGVTLPSVVSGAVEVGLELGEADVPVGLGVAVPVGLGVAVPVGLGVAVPVGLGVALPVGLGVALPVGLGVAVPVGLGVAVPVGPGRGVVPGAGVDVPGDVMDGGTGAAGGWDAGTSPKIRVAA
jgi:hypothetical protein